jgi:hypothetical protein
MVSGLGAIEQPAIAKEISVMAATSFLLCKFFIFI